MYEDRYLLRMAGRIHRHLSRPIPMTRPEWHAAATELLTRLSYIELHWLAASKAQDRGWNIAAAARQQQVLAEAYRIQLAAERVISLPMRPEVPSNPVTLRTIVEELEQLKHEFEDVELDLKLGTVAVTTPPIELEDIYLGPFSIELQVHRLADRPGSECFRCIALEPNPAASSSDTVHPHVQDGHLCAGDATMPITLALQEGRIADAFVLIRSVLQSYNSDSPYVALENWTGTRCQDCDYLADSEGMYFCDGCERDICEDCYSSCDICDCGCCRSCLETDTVSGNRCCSACRQTCSVCSRTVDSDSFDQETELCPACLEKQQQENKHEDESKPFPAPSPTTEAAPVTASACGTTVAPPVAGVSAAA